MSPVDVLMAEGRWQEALLTSDSAFAPGALPPDRLAIRGHALLELRRDAESLECFERALAREPALAAARLGRSRALLRLGQADAARAALLALLAEQPRNAGAKAIVAAIALAQRDTDAAWEAAAESLAIDPNEAIALTVRGHVLLERSDPWGALTALDAAVRANPVLGAAHHARGRALAALRRTADAIHAYGVAGRFDPNHAAPAVEAGYLKIQMNDFAGAAADFAQALERQPGHVAALRGRAQCLFAAGRAAEAVVAYSQLLEAAPDTDYMRGERFHAQLHCCDWRDYEATRRDLTERVRRGERADIPGCFMVYSDSPADQLLCARTFIADVCAGALGPRTRAASRRAGRLRVAYLSADFHAHATAFLAAGLFEAHDRSKYETYGISFGPDDGSAMRGRLARAFEHFEDVRSLSDSQIASLISERGIDIAVDLKGHTLGARPRIFALRCAPVQVSFLAYPGTMGADFMDYIVADRHVIPEHARIHYAEQVIYLPECYQVNDSARTAEPRPTRAGAGLPQSGFVFCCFNASYKISPGVFAVWMQILEAIPHSVLWLLEGGAAAVQNLSREAAERGVDPRRLVFAPWKSAATHLARCALADLYLDTLPTNAHTGASDALWAGVPVVTVAGETFTSRVATSLLQALGLGQLSVDSLDDYRRLALRIAASPAEHGALKRKLSAARHTARLFDSAGYCRQLEAAFEEIIGRHRRGEPPAPIRVPG